jgi:hypothetical protein
MLENIDLAGLINSDPFLLFFGTFYIILGVSILIAPKQWQEFIKLFIEYDSLSLVIGILSLPISLFIVVFYDNWVGLAPTVLMVLGYIGLLKSLLLLLRPSLAQGFLNKGFIQKYLWLDGVSGVVLGAAMLLL